MNFGLRLKTLRKSRDLTLKEFSALSEVSVSFLSEMERNDKSPSLDTLYKIAAALNLTVADLLEQIPSSIPNNILELLNVIQSLSPKQQNYLNLFLKELNR